MRILSAVQAMGWVILTSTTTQILTESCVLFNEELHPPFILIFLPYNVLRLSYLGANHLSANLTMNRTEAYHLLT